MRKNVNDKKDRILEIGTGILENIDSILSRNEITGKILYVSDDVVDSLYGETVKIQLDHIGSIKTELVDNNTIAFAMSLAERMIATDIDYIIGLGGGKVLDVCKYAAFISKKPFISIPTTIANDGLASPIAVLKRRDNKPKSLGCAMPSLLIIDTGLISNAPHKLIKAGIGDAISNYMALIDWEFAVKCGKDSMNGFAYLMSKTSLDMLMNTQFDTICPIFIEQLADSLILSGIAMEFAGSSRPVSGSEHLFSHALDYYASVHNLHGIQTALGTVAVLKLLKMPYESILNYLRKFDVIINPQILQISRDDFILCMQKATSMRSDRYTYLHELELSDKTLEKIYEELVEEL